MKNLLDPGSRTDVIIPVLGIMPLLLVANSFKTAAAIGMVSLLVVSIASVIISAIRNLLPVEIRLPVMLLVITSVVSLVYILMQFWFYAVSQQLGIYIPLIAMNCLVLAWVEEYALRHGVIKSLLHTLQAGLGILAILIVIGVIREYAGLSLLKQPAGAFLVFGLMVALYNLAGNQQRQSD
jgi:Na+-translocating ferredoxin:NAD+ oxidoreductase subunit E